MCVCVCVCVHTQYVYVHYPLESVDMTWVLIKLLQCLILETASLFLQDEADNKANQIGNEMVSESTLMTCVPVATRSNHIACILECRKAQVKEAVGEQEQRER